MGIRDYKPALLRTRHCDVLFPLHPLDRCHPLHTHFISCHGSIPSQSCETFCPNPRRTVLSASMACTCSFCLRGEAKTPSTVLEERGMCPAAFPPSAVTPTPSHPSSPTPSSSSNSLNLTHHGARQPTTACIARSEVCTLAAPFMSMPPTATVTPPYSMSCSVPPPSARLLH